MSRVTRLLLAVALVLSAGTIASAQEDEAAPPQRAGRISAIEGILSMREPEEDGWTNARVNYPVSTGMSLSTDPGGRAEIQLGGTTLRLDGATTITLLALDERTTAIAVDEGSLNLRSRVLFEDEDLVLEAAHARVTILQTGSYRIDAGDNNEPTHVVAFAGRAELETSRGVEEVQSGEGVQANSTGQVRHMRAQATTLDDWADRRELAYAGRNSERYVGAGTPGYEDLDDAGIWQTTAQYGAVWYPTGMPYNWEPYAFGQWSWISPWGWTWIDDQPWGFAPFHYGRWVHVGGRWGWCPGDHVRRRVYAPALVGFIGNDPWHFHSRGVRPRGWVPLAPGEIYHAPYTRNVAYLRLVNRTNVRNDALDRHDWRRRDRDNDNNWTNGRHWRQGNRPDGTRFDRRDDRRNDDRRDQVVNNGPRHPNELRGWQRRNPPVTQTAVPAVPSATPSTPATQDDRRRDWRRNNGVSNDNIIITDGPRSPAELRTWQRQRPGGQTPDEQAQGTAPIPAAVPTAPAGGTPSASPAQTDDGRRDWRGRNGDATPGQPGTTGRNFRGRNGDTNNANPSTPAAAPTPLIPPAAGGTPPRQDWRREDRPDRQERRPPPQFTAPAATQQPDGPRSAAQLRGWQRQQPSSPGQPAAPPTPSAPQSMPSMAPSMPSMSTSMPAPRGFRAMPPPPPPPSSSASQDSSAGQVYQPPPSASPPPSGPSSPNQLRGWQRGN